VGILQETAQKIKKPLEEIGRLEKIFKIPEEKRFLW